MTEDAPKPSMEEERERAERLKRLLLKESMRAVGESNRDRVAADWWSSRPVGRARRGGKLR
jgi:hypothetical protein